VGGAPLGLGGATNYTVSPEQSINAILQAPASYSGGNFSSWTGCNVDASLVDPKQCRIIMNESPTGGSSRTIVANYTASSPPSTPILSAVHSSTCGSGQIDLSWNNVANETGYVLEYSTNSSSGPWSNLVTLGADVTSYPHTGLSAGTLYYGNPSAYNAQDGRATFIYFDEWQDTNKIQYTMMKLLVSNNENITAVGDASQSIYSWRGADYRNINNFLRDFHNTTVINLEQNYRSTQIILDAANAIITKNTSHPVLSLWTDNPKGDKIAIYTAKNGFDEASYLADEVRSLKTVGYAYKDIAVLYRTNAQSRVIEESLLHAGIPYILIGGVKFYDRAEIKDLLAYLRLLVNPNDTVAHTRVEKIGVKRLQNFEKLKDDIGDAETYQTQDLLDKIITQTGYLEKFAKETEENYQKKENIKELRSVATQFPNIFEFLENVALVEAEENKTHTETNEAITLMTIHAAKGLEFPVVFLIGMEEGLFPHSRTLFDTQQLEEERRLAYVGVTRAKEMLYITYADKRLYFGQQVSNPPSRFLIDIPQELLRAASTYRNSQKSWEFE
jgi:DNA helicase-2/ATP-dependent DNA helicase PcrA